MQLTETIQGKRQNLHQLMSSIKSGKLGTP